MPDQLCTLFNKGLIMLCEFRGTKQNAAFNYRYEKLQSGSRCSGQDLNWIPLKYVSHTCYYSTEQKQFKSVRQGFILVAYKTFLFHFDLY